MKLPETVEEDLENISEQELSIKKERKWLRFFAYFMITIVIIYYVF